MAEEGRGFDPRTEWFLCAHSIYTHVPCAHTYRSRALICALSLRGGQLWLETNFKTADLCIE